MAHQTEQGDLTGLSPVYYSPTHLYQGFVNTPEKLLVSPDVEHIDKTTLAAAILWPGLGLLGDNYTYFKDVRRLRPGETAAIVDGKLKTELCYPAENPDLTFDTAAERLGRALHDIIKQLVEQASGRFISSDFSGGLDSTVLAFAAAKRYEGKKVLGLMQHNWDHPSGDAPYVSQFAELSYQNFYDLTIFTEGLRENKLPFALTPPSDISPSEPYRSYAIFGREQQRMRDAKAIHLTGNGGDVLFDPEPIPVLADLLSQGEEVFAKEIALSVGRAALGSPQEILATARQRSKSGLAASLERVSRQLRSGQHYSEESSDWLPGLGLAGSWLTPEMREAVAARAEELAQRAPEMSYGTFTTLNSIFDSGDVHRHLQMLAERSGTTATAPYLGETALAAVLSLPAPLRIQPGEFKPLLRATAESADLAPDELFVERKGKGSYTRELYAGFKRSLGTIQAQLKNSRLARLGIIDSEAVLASLSRGDLPMPSLIQLLASDNWLGQPHFDLHLPEVHPPTSLPEASPVKEQPAFPTQNYMFRKSLHIVAGPEGQYGAFDHERGLFLPPVGEKQATRLILEGLSTTNSPKASLALLKRYYPQVAEEQLAADLVSTVQTLAAKGWLQPVDTSTLQPQKLPLPTHTEVPPEAGEVMRVRKSALSPAAVPPEVEILGRQSFEKALQLTEAPFTELKKFIIQGNAAAARQASAKEALYASELARLVTDKNTTHRIACYELSLAAALFCLSNGLSVDWCLGMSFGPKKPAYHAWLEVQSEPIRAKGDEVVTGVYQRLLRLGGEVSQ